MFPSPIRLKILGALIVSLMYTCIQNIAQNAIDTVVYPNHTCPLGLLLHRTFCAPMQYSWQRSVRLDTGEFRMTFGCERELTLTTQPSPQTLIFRGEGYYLRVRCQHHRCCLSVFVLLVLLFDWD